jgi:hypothetical protein
MDAVLDESIKTAVQFLEKYGEFFPFAVVKTSDGQITHVQTWGHNERPSAQEVIQELFSGLKHGAGDGSYRTTALVSDVRLRDKECGASTDAIRVEIEDAEARPVTCYLPYSRTLGGVNAGDITAENGDSRVFPNIPGFMGQLTELQ